MWSAFSMSRGFIHHERHVWNVSFNNSLTQMSLFYRNTQITPSPLMCDASQTTTVKISQITKLNPSPSFFHKQWLRNMRSPPPPSCIYIKNLRSAGRTSRGGVLKIESLQISAVFFIRCVFLSFSKLGFDLNYFMSPQTGMSCRLQKSGKLISF